MPEIEPVPTNPEKYPSEEADGLRPDDLSPDGLREEETEKHPLTRKDFTRRDFLKLAATATATASAIAILEACSPVAKTPPVAPPAVQEYDEVPDAVPAQNPGELTFLTTDEAKTVDAITARLMPGSLQDPGAHEAGVVYFIDKTLSWNKGPGGWTEYTYIQGPYAKAYEGDTPPGPDDQQTVYIKKDELERYGFQGKQSPQDVYRKGVANVDNYASQNYGNKFADLTSDQQDEILTAMQNGKTDFSEPEGKAFFKLIYEHTIQGMFADPAYGGNQDMVGWKLIDYPGSQRAYTPTDMHSEVQGRPPQSLAMLHPFHPGQFVSPGVIVPPSGSDIQNLNGHH